MKYHFPSLSRFLAVALIFPLLLNFAACGLTESGSGTSGSTQGSSSEEATTADDSAAALDTTGTYLLSDSGEAVISDVDFTYLTETDDNYRVFYEIFVGSFSDSDGDGIGDLRGIINRMDYLNDGDPESGESLGVEGIWLTPIFKSPSYHKYDVADYYEIDEDFGTMEDLQELIDLCHERGVKIIIDLPINHTSTSNSMYTSFVLAHRQEDTESEYYDFYSYYTEGETAPAGKTYSAIAGTDIYYECNFSTDMPELNFDNEAVREEVVNIASFYLEMGIDGFRFDAAKYIYYDDNAASAEFWTWYMDELKAIDPDIYTVAEVWDSDAVTDQYYGALNCFNFTTSQATGLIAEAAKAGNVNSYTSYVESYLDKILSLNADAMMVPFIANHDTDRAAGYLTVASGRMMMAANLYILNTGSPFIYYGEEIGMRGSRGGSNTDANRRLAMLWGDGDTVEDPEGTDYDSENQVDSSVAAQLGDGSALYNYYKRLIMIRQANPEIARGEYHALSLDDKMGGFTATWNGSTVCVLHNTTTRSISVDLSELGDFTYIAASIGVENAEIDGTTLTVGGQTSVVLR
ncbi:MAG: hypothetical protein LUE29_01460 [Lachnospiraceae bacterium]|nr:hypothetical protein [Lachnospiraceae bacterium]